MAQLSQTVRTDRSGRSIPIVSWLARKNRGYYLAGYLLLAFLAVWTFFPFYWQLATSLPRCTNSSSVSSATVISTGCCGRRGPRAG